MSRYSPSASNLSGKLQYATEEEPEEGDGRREMVYKVAVALLGHKGQVEHEIELSEMCEKDVEEGPGKTN